MEGERLRIVGGYVGHTTKPLPRECVTKRFFEVTDVTNSSIADTVDEDTLCEVYGLSTLVELDSTLFPYRRFGYMT